MSAFLHLCQELGLDALVEVHTTEELERLSKEKALEQHNLATIEKKEREREVALLSRLDPTSAAAA